MSETATGSGSPRPGRLRSVGHGDGEGCPIALAGGGRRIELAFLDGYPYAQVFAPAEDDVVAFEPMTAPTNALVDGGPELSLVAPGDGYRAAFAITVTEAA